jgi:hypothetical protein
MPTNLERAGVIAKQVQLRSIILRNARVESDVDPLDPPDQIQLRQAHRARYELPNQHPDHIYVYVDLHFAAANAEGHEPSSERLELEATYLLVYALQTAAQHPEDALQHFAELNGAYNVWPYWRELVQTVAGRVGLAAIVVPVFRPPVRKLEEQNAEGSLLAAEKTSA